MDNRFRFRAWLKKHKKIATVLTLKDAGYIETDIATIWSEQWIPPDDYILMQCTGLLATSSYRGEREEDRLIYEGDIIQTTNGYIFSVVWIDEDVSFGLKNIFGERGGNCWLTPEAKIIGNIHENPELLA